MRFVTTKGAAPRQSAVSFAFALFEGIAPDGGLYVPESIPRWSPEELAKLPSMTLADVGARVLQPFVDELDYDALLSIVEDALSFPIPLVEVEPGIYALELFHGPTLAFKDVGARVMARLMAALFRGDNPLTILVATSGDTGSAVAHAFHDVPHTRVVILYPKGRISPTQEAQLTMFNGEATNVRAYATAGSFDDCQRLTKAAFADPVLSRRANLTSANSINIGRLLPQMIYYAHAVGQLRRRRGRVQAVVFSTPSGNFGNLTAGLMAKRLGHADRPVCRRHQCQRRRAASISSPAGSSRARRSTRVANAMDVGNPSNFDRLMWLYGGDLDAIRRDVTGSRHDDDEVRATIRKVYEERGYLLDPHSAIAYLGLEERGGAGQAGSGHGRRVPRDRASGEVRGDRRAGDRPCRSRSRSRWSMRWRRSGQILEIDATLGGGREGPWLSIRLPGGCAEGVRAARHHADAAHAAGARPRIRARPVLLRAARAARSDAAPGVSRSRIRRPRHRAARHLSRPVAPRPRVAGLKDAEFVLQVPLAGSTIGSDAHGTKIDRAPPADADELTAKVYNELRRLAGAFMRRERPGQTIQATALVHEAYLRLAGAGTPWKDERHFVGIAARSMRQILVERARARGAQKRWGGLDRVSLVDSLIGAPQRGRHASGAR